MPPQITLQRKEVDAVIEMSQDCHYWFDYNNDDYRLSTTEAVAQSMVSRSNRFYALKNGVSSYLQEFGDKPVAANNHATATSSDRLDKTSPHFNATFTFDKMDFDGLQRGDTGFWAKVDGVVQANTRFEPSDSPNNKFEIVWDAARLFDYGFQLVSNKIIQSGQYAKTFSALLYGRVRSQLQRVLQITVRCQHEAGHVPVAGDVFVASVSCNLIMGGGLVNYFLPRQANEEYELDGEKHPPIGESIIDSAMSDSVYDYVLV